jgi:hypothetical protein
MREDDVSVIKGLVMILDMSTITVAHMTHMTPTYTKKILVVTTVSKIDHMKQKQKLQGFFIGSFPAAAKKQQFHQHAINFQHFSEPRKNDHQGQDQKKSNFPTQILKTVINEINFACYSCSCTQTCNHFKSRCRSECCPPSMEVRRVHSTNSAVHNTSCINLDALNLQKGNVQFLPQNNGLRKSNRTTTGICQRRTLEWMRQSGQENQKRKRTYLASKDHSGSWKSTRIFFI